MTMDSKVQLSRMTTASQHSLRTTLCTICILCHLTGPLKKKKKNMHVKDFPDASSRSTMRWVASHCLCRSERHGLALGRREPSHQRRDPLFWNTGPIKETAGILTWELGRVWQTCVAWQEDDRRCHVSWLAPCECGDVAGQGTGKTVGDIDCPRVPWNHAVCAGRPQGAIVGEAWRAALEVATPSGRTRQCWPETGVT